MCLIVFFEALPCLSVLAFFCLLVSKLYLIGDYLSVAFVTGETEREEILNYMSKSI